MSDMIMKNAIKKSPTSQILKPVQYLTWDETGDELSRISEQLCILHDLPDVNFIKPVIYMNDAFEGLRRRLIELHWARINLVRKKYQK